MPAMYLQEGLFMQATTTVSADLRPLSATMHATDSPHASRKIAYLQVAEIFFDKSKLLKWLLARLRPREFDSNKQSASELLAILLQNSPKNQQRLADANGIDALLQVSRCPIYQHSTSWC